MVVALPIIMGAVVEEVAATTTVAVVIGTEERAAATMAITVAILDQLSSACPLTPPGTVRPAPSSRPACLDLALTQQQQRLGLSSRPTSPPSSTCSPSSNWALCSRNQQLQQAHFTGSAQQQPTWAPLYDPNQLAHSLATMSLQQPSGDW